jgi:hypothetical protein
MKPETSLPSICDLLARETEARQARRLSYFGLRPTVVWKRQNEKPLRCIPGYLLAAPLALEKSPIEFPNSRLLSAFRVTSEWREVKASSG